MSESKKFQKIICDGCGDEITEDNKKIVLIKNKKIQLIYYDIENDKILRF